MTGMRFVAAVAAIIMITPPCVAADDFRESGPDYRRGAFAGATLKIPMGGNDRTTPRTHFGLGISQVYARTSSAGATQRLQIPGMEVRLTATGKPLLMIAGQNTASIKRQLGVANSTKTALLVVGGVAVAALAATLLSNDSNDSEDRSCPIIPPC